MKPIETILQSQRKMYGFDKNPMLGKAVIDDPDVAHDMKREEKRGKEQMLDELFRLEAETLLRKSALKLSEKTRKSLGKPKYIEKKELDFMDAYRNAGCYDEYIVNLTHQRPIDQDELELAQVMWDEINSDMQS